MARILVIEDNAANLGLISYLLTAFGHTVESCRDGQSGLDAARSRPYDLVLCDIQLPKLSGYEIARALRADPAFRELPLIAVTALAMRGDREQVLAAGFKGYIEKPVEPESFVTRVESFLPVALHKGSPLNAAPAPVAPGPDSGPPKAPLPGPQFTVLVVDDVASNLSLMQVILQSVGYRVLTAANMREGLESMRRQTVDLVVSDIHMPSGDGFTFRRAAAAEPELADVPFIFVSSSVVREDERQKVRALGAFDLLERPIEARALICMARDCLDRRR